MLIIPRARMLLIYSLQEEGFRIVWFVRPAPIVLSLSLFERKLNVPVRRNWDVTYTERKRFLLLLLLIEVYTGLDFNSHAERDITFINRFNQSIIDDLLGFDLTISLIIHLKRDLSESPRTFDSSSRFSTIVGPIVLTNFFKVRELTKLLNASKSNWLREPDFVLEVETSLLLHLTLNSYAILEGLKEFLKEGLRIPIRIVIRRVIKSTNPNLTSHTNFLNLIIII